MGENDWLLLLEVGAEGTGGHGDEGDRELHLDLAFGAESCRKYRIQQQKLNQNEALCRPHCHLRVSMTSFHRSRSVVSHAVYFLVPADFSRSVYAYPFWPKSY
jgi:hypothetical protein